jgi:hypothetical protein
MRNHPIQPTTGAAIMQRKGSNFGVTSAYQTRDHQGGPLKIHNAVAVFRLCSAQLNGIETAFRESERVCRSPEEAGHKPASGQSMQEDIVSSNAMDYMFVAFTMVQQI